MTPTLFGRWQTRLFLLSTVGIIITIPFYLLFSNNPDFFIVLLSVFLLGLVWDTIYNFLQKLRWDHDWPGTLQLLSGIVEGIVIGVLCKTNILPVSSFFKLQYFIVHYIIVWLAVYTCSQTVMRVIFPRWRFRGGQLI